MIVEICPQPIIRIRKERNKNMHYKASKYLEVNGIRLHYAEAGQGRPVLLLHGNGEDHDLLHVEMTQLAETGFHVYAPDSRGHGAN